MHEAMIRFFLELNPHVCIIYLEAWHYAGYPAQTLHSHVTVLYRTVSPCCPCEMHWNTVDGTRDENLCPGTARRSRCSPRTLPDLMAKNVEEKEITI